MNSAVFMAPYYYGAYYTIHTIHTIHILWFLL